MSASEQGAVDQSSIAADAKARGGDRTADAPSTREPPEALRQRELIGVVALIVLCDVTIYRGKGFAGYAVLFFAAPILLWWSSHRRRRGPAFWTVSLMLAALAGKLAWCGTGLQVGIGFALIVAFAMTLVGLRPYVLEAVFFALQTLYAGYRGIVQYGRRAKELDPIIRQPGWSSVVMPLLAFLVFGWIFVRANPDLTVWFGEGVKRAFDVLQVWVDSYSPDLLEVAFWIAVVWIVVGLLRPRIELMFNASPDVESDKGTMDEPEVNLYAALRNTLVTVIVLFAVYLAFEYTTLWFREFPRGFHYSGYAHEGAAWLTAALALATVILSMVFRGDILRDPRSRALRRLAWLWSIENMILAAAVYNRLYIYIGFNGMSRMRIVGLYGITTVVVGFVLVVVKIARNRDFLWLVRGHLWTLATAIYLLALTPSDAIVVGYNVRRILAGDPAPAVQISVHPINSEGILLLQPLLDCDDEIVRQGVAGLLADNERQAESTAAHRQELGWTTFQIADRIALDEFRANNHRWAPYAETAPRRRALKRFHDYAYQWY